MYLPSRIFIGPLPLFSVLIAVSILVTSLTLSHYHAPERVQDLLWYGVMGAVLGEKGMYIITAFRYYLAHPAHLIFTPQSSLGMWGSCAGAAIAIVFITIRFRSMWKITDWDYLALALGPGLTLLSLGVNWLGIPSRLPFVTIFYRHLDRFATFLLWGLLMGLTSLLTSIAYHTHHYRPGQLAGMFSLLTAINLIIAQLTAVRYQFQFSALDWLSMTLALTGYLLMGPEPLTPDVGEVRYNKLRIVQTEKGEKECTL